MAFIKFVIDNLSMSYNLKKIFQIHYDDFFSKLNFFSVIFINKLNFFLLLLKNYNVFKLKKCQNYFFKDGKIQIANCAKKKKINF